MRTAFDSTSQKRRLLKQLREKVWWWRKLRIRSSLKKAVNWPAVEEAARNYELLRRTRGGKTFTRPYTDLSRNERTIIHGLWAGWSPAPYRFVTDRRQFEEIGWSPIYEHQHRQWNLRLAPGDLVKEFVREIKVLQKIHKIRAPHPLKGEKTRISWLLVEILDCQSSGLGPFTDSQRHSLSVARRKATKHLREYKKALAKQAVNPDPFD